MGATSIVPTQVFFFAFTHLTYINPAFCVRRFGIDLAHLCGEFRHRALFFSGSAIFELNDPLEGLRLNLIMSRLSRLMINLT